MAVDRGGLNYGIVVEDQFSKTVSSFREQIQAARSDFAAFKKELGGNKASKADLKDITTEIKKQSDARRQQASVEEESIARAKRTIRELRVELTTLTKLRQRDAQITEGLSSTQLAALLRVRKAQRDTAITQEELNRLRKEGIIGARQIGKQELTVAQQLEVARNEYKQLTAATSAQQEADRQQLTVLRQLNRELRNRATAAELNRQRQQAGLPTPESVKAQKDAIKARQEQARQEAQILANQARARKDAERASARAAQQSARAAALAAREQARAAREQERANAKAAREANAADDRASRLLFTFRRLFGIFAAFQAIRFGFNLFKDAIRGALEFNALIEDSQLGIQSILVAVGDVRDSQGQLVTGTKAFALAQQEAGRQTRLLRRDALATTATFETLLETFQTALAPGLSAGLSTDQIRKFSSRVSQAAAAIGLPQSQLAEEIRSLLQGTIQQRTTRIAVALGITNEDIRRAKEAGRLADFLFEKFQAFEIAGQSALGNFTVIVQKLRDGVAQLLGESSVDFFNDVKTALSDLLQTLVIQTKEGVVINPKAVAIVREIVNGLQRGFDFVKKIASQLTFEQGLEFARTFGRLLELSIKVLASGALGALRAFTLIARVIGDIVSIIEKIGTTLSKFLPAGLGDNFVATLVEALILARVVRAVLATFGISLLRSVEGLTGFNSLMRNAGILTGNLQAGIKGVTSTVVKLLPLISFFSLGFILVNEIINGTIADTKVFGVRIGDIIGLVANGLVGAFKVVAQVISTGVDVALFGVQETTFSLVNAFDDAALAAKKLFIGLTSDSETAAQQTELLNKEQATLLDQRNKDAKSRSDKFLQNLNNQRAEVDRIIEETRLTTQALLSGEPREDTADVAAFRNKVRSLVAAITGASQNINDDVEQNTDSVARLEDAFSTIPPSIFAQSEALKEVDRLLKDSTEDSRKLSNELSKASAQFGLEGIAKDFVGILKEGEFEIAQATRKIAEAERAQQQNLIGIRARQAELRANSAIQSKAEEQQLEKQLALGQQLRAATLEQQTAALELKQVERELIAARATGDKSEIDSLEKKKAGIKQQLDTSTQVAQNVIKTSQDQLRASGLTAEAQQRVVNNAAELATLLAQEAGTQGEIEDLANSRAQIESAINGLIQQRIAIQAAADAARLRQDNQRLQAEIQVARVRATALVPGLAPRAAESIQIQADILALELKKRKIQEVSDANVRALEAEQQRARTQEEELAILGAIAEEYQNQQLQIEAVNIDLEVARQRAEELRRQAEDPINFGIERGFQEFVNTSLDTFTSTLDIMRNALNGFADTIGGSIADALLNPNEAVNVRERFRRLFDQIAREGINQLVRFAFAKAILGVGLADGGPVPVVSKHSGGRIPSRGRASLAHYIAPTGRSMGGPPPGVDPRDRTPFWGQAGEWIIPVKQVAKYGAFAMSAVQHGLIDPLALRALAGAGRVSEQHRKSGQIGYATGGEIVPPSSLSAVRTAAVRGEGGIKIVNVLDRSQIHEEIASDRGRRVVTNVMDSRNAKYSRR